MSSIGYSFKFVFSVLLLVAVARSSLDVTSCVFAADKPEATNAVELFALSAEGNRLYTCYSNGTVNPVSTIGSSANLTGLPPLNPEQVTGIFNYTQGGQAVFYVTEEIPGATLDSTFVLSDDYLDFPSPNGQLSWRRRNITSPSETVTGKYNETYTLEEFIVPAYLLRTDTKGGLPPAICPQGATSVTVPYVATYQFDSCSTTPPSPPSSGLQASLVFTIALTIFLSVIY